MRDYVKPGNSFRLPFRGGGEEGEIVVSGEYDAIHYFRPMAAWILKYVSNDGISNILIPEESAKYLSEQCGVPVAERSWMSAKEHEEITDWRTAELSESDLGLDFDE